MYLIDFLKRLTKKSNITILIYLLINIFIIAIVTMKILNQPIGRAFLIGVVLYTISMVITLSPIGEWILRFQNGCKKINRIEHINRIEPLFREVYEKAKKLDASIPSDVNLFISDEQSPNAFATGRKTICLTEGLLKRSDGEIKATLAHEFGHLAHKDTDLILLVSVGNLIVTGIILFIRFIVVFLHFIFDVSSRSFGGIVAAITNAIVGLMVNIIISGLMWIWTKVGIILVMKASRENEYAADEFSFNLGYGDDLCKVLDEICGNAKNGLFANLASSHPSKHDRISKLQQLGSTYRAAYGSY